MQGREGTMFLNCRKISFIFIVTAFASFGTVSRSDAFLSQIWDTITGWFGGGSKQPSVAEQLPQLLQAVNGTQNDLIRKVNDIITLQEQMQSASDPAQRQALEQKMQAMQAAIEANSQSYGQLMQVRDVLQQSGDLGAYEAQFGPYIAKQQEIEAIYPDIEERYLALMNAGVGNANEAQVQTQAQQAAAQPMVEPWNDPSVQARIDQYLASRNMTPWGIVKVDGATYTTPMFAMGKNRYQYLLDNFPEIMQHVGSSHAAANPVAAATPAPAAPSSSIVAPAAPSSSSGGNGGTAMIFAPVPGTQNPAHASLKQQKDAIYRELLNMQAQGKLGSEEYKDKYLEYTRIQDQMR